MKRQSRPCRPASGLSRGISAGAGGGCSTGRWPLAAAAAALLQGYKAPAKIDPRLLDPKYIFQASAEPSSWRPPVGKGLAAPAV